MMTHDSMSENDVNGDFISFLFINKISFTRIAASPLPAILGIKPYCTCSCINACAAWKWLDESPQTAMSLNVCGSSKDMTSESSGTKLSLNSFTVTLPYTPACFNARSHINVFRGVK